MKRILNLLFKASLIFFIISLPFEKRHIFGVFEEFNTISIYISDIFFVLSLILGVALSIYSTRNIRISPYIKGFLIILPIITLFTLVSSPRETFNDFLYIKSLELIILAAFFALIFKIEEYKDLTLKAVVASGIIQTVIAAGQFISQSSLGLKLLGEPTIANSINGIAKIDILGEKIIRAYGTFVHPNQLAAFILVACATCFYLFLKSETKKQQLILGLSLFILIFGEFLSFSRIGLISLYFFFLAMFTVLFLVPKYSLNLSWLKPTGTKLFLIILIATISAGSLLSPYLKARMQVQTPEVYNRELYNQAGIEIWKEHPLLGVGIGNTFNEMSKKLAHTEPWQVQMPHNFFIIIAAETGLVGLLLVVGFFIYLLRRLAKKIHEQGSELNLFALTLLLTLLSILILMQFDHYFYTLQQTQLLLYLVVGMIIAATSRKTPIEHPQQI